MLTTSGLPTPPNTERRPAGILLRLAAMTYEGVLLFGVVFVVSYALLALTRWTYPLGSGQRTVLQATLFLTLGLYFVYQWRKTGQTLAMKSWHVRLVDGSGGAPSVARAVLRYVGAWHLFLPGAVWVAFFGGNVINDLVAVACSLAILLLPGAFDPRKRLLHDRLSRTYVLRER